MNRLQESVVWKKKYRHDDYLEKECYYLNEINFR